MTIQEAIKSGKPFKRDAWIDSAWMYVEENIFKMTNEILDTTLEVDDILADDWFTKNTTP